MNKSKSLIISFLLLFSIANLFSQKVDTVAVFSQKMGRSIKNVVITPAGYEKNASVKYPVLYLLHGYSGDHRGWISSKPNLPQIATANNMIIVCPNGETSWYWDSPINPQSQFDTFVSKELVEYIDKNYKTLASREGRAITGLSMGGQGSLYLAMNHSDVYGACGSMAGGADIRPYPNNWDMKKNLGEYSENQDVWDKFTVMNQIHKFKPGSLRIIIDCGYDDFFFHVNEELHKQLLYYKIPHDYIVRPGAHNGEYWNESLDTQIVFFSKFFNSKK